MDHMRISGTESSSVILSQTGSLEKIMTKMCQKQAEAKRDGLINPQNYNFNQFQTRKILMLSKRYESTEVNRRTWLHVPSGIHWSTSRGLLHHNDKLKNIKSSARDNKGVRLSYFVERSRYLAARSRC